MATVFSATLTPKQKIDGQVRFAVSAPTSSLGKPGLIEKDLNFSLPSEVNLMDTNYTWTITIDRS